MNRAVGYMILMAVVVSMTVSSCSGLIDSYTSSIPIRVRMKSVESKSAPITTESISEFQLIAIADGPYHDNEQNHPAGFYFEERVSRSGINWGMDNDHFWLNQVSLHFWSYSPTSSNLNTAAKGLLQVQRPSAGDSSLGFSYSLPTHVEGADADVQKDIVFACNSESRTFGGSGVTGHTSSNTAYIRNDNEVDIVFHHALSEVCFSVSPTDGSFDTEGLQIVDIAISDIAGNGECSFSLPNNFAWTWGESDKVYSQTVNATFDTCPDGWTQSIFNDDQTLYTFDNAFFMIPQELTNAVLSVTFKRNGEDPRVIKDVLLNDIWEPGKYYKYKIGATRVGLVDINLSVTLSIHAWEEIGNSTILE